MEKNFKKVLATSAIAALVFAASANAVFAGSEASAEVVDDGNSYSLSKDNDDFDVENYQHGSLFNADLGIGVSGGNDQSDNDDENGMGTGSSEGFAGSDNFLNSNITAIEDSEEDGSANAQAIVGEDGDATAKAYDNDEVSVENHNYAYLENLTLGLAISGLNTQDGNDDGNEMTTGDSEAHAAAWNEVNSNWTSVGGSHSAFASAEVGDDGNAYSLAKDNDTVEVYNKNKANVNNVSAAIAVSGGNSQSWNDDDNSMETGSSTAESSANNFVNSNVTVVGSSNGGGSTADAIVGEDGDATSKSFDNDEVSVENKNKAEVTNVSVAAGVSGGNTQSSNDDGNTMTTGASHGSSCSTNTVNSNWTVIGGSLPEGSETGCN